MRWCVSLPLCGWCVGLSYRPAVRVGTCAAVTRPRGGAPVVMSSSFESSGDRGRVEALWRYPIKGFPADSLESATLRGNGTFDLDRVWALLDVADDGGWDAAAPAWVHKQHFFGAFRSRDALATQSSASRAVGGFLRCHFQLGVFSTSDHHESDDLTWSTDVFYDHSERRDDLKESVSLRDDAREPGASEYVDPQRVRSGGDSR